MTRFKQTSKIKLPLLRRVNKKRKILVKSKLLSNNILQVRRDNGLLHHHLVKIYRNKPNQYKPKKTPSPIHFNSNPNQPTRLNQQPLKATHLRPNQFKRLSQQPLNPTSKRRTKKRNKANLSSNHQSTPSPNVPPQILQQNQSNQKRSLNRLNSQVSDR